jgi:hypothetical protein
MEIDAPVYDIDLLEALPSKRRVRVPGFGRYTVRRGQNAGAIDELHADGRIVVCYIDTGAWESYWPDAALFPKSVCGRDTGWRGERWLDVRPRSWKRFAPLIWARLDLAAELGCDAVEGDQNNGAENRDGFPVSKGRMVRWYREVFAQTHARGMSAVQKNGISRVRPILEHPGDDAAREPDALLIEECAQFRECGRLGPWEGTDKAVWQVEYRPRFDRRGFKRRVCPDAIAAGRFALLKREPPDGGYRRVCPYDGARRARAGARRPGFCGQRPCRAGQRPWNGRGGARSSRQAEQRPPNPTESPPPHPAELRLAPPGARRAWQAPPGRPGDEPRVGHACHVQSRVRGLRGPDSCEAL